MRGKLYSPPHLPGSKSLLLRVGIVVALFIVVVFLMYFEGGLIDSKTGEPPGFLDSLYFTMVTITTVGYGDIVPHSTFARMTDTFILAPMRFIVLFVFVGIAYNVAFRRLQEDYRMSRAVNQLKDHTIVCGYGETGRAALTELLNQGADPKQIVVAEMDEGALEEASQRGVVTIQGDATKEEMLKSLAIERAKHVLICPGRDDTAVLITLTVSDLNPRAQLIVMCHELENIRLIERSGADTIVSPSFAGGNMMAASTRRPHIVDTMKNLLSISGSLHMDERIVRPDEVGKRPNDLDGISVIRLYRSGARFEVSNFPLLEEDDVIVFVAGRENLGESTAKPEAAPEGLS